tara:strand:+ start:268 stop:447 length:180 start_codon:yes stop_codon:yes gene_type:complete
MKKFLNTVRDILEVIIEFLEEDDTTKTAVPKKRGCGCGGKKLSPDKKKDLDKLKSKLFN